MRRVAPTLTYLNCEKHNKKAKIKSRKFILFTFETL